MSGEMAAQGEAQPRPAQSFNYAQFVRPEQMMSLPHFDQAQRLKYQDALRKLWQIVEQTKANPSSPEFRNAITNLSTASQKIRQHVKLKNEEQRAREAGIQAPVTQAGSSSQTPAGGQAQPAQGTQQPQQAQQSQVQQRQQSQQQQPQQQQQRPQSQQGAQPTQGLVFPPVVLGKINSIQWATPSGTVAGSAEADAQLLAVKQMFGHAMIRELTSRDQITKMQPVIQGYNSRNVDTPQEMKVKYNQLRTTMQQAQETQKRILAEQATLRQQNGPAPNTSQQPAQPGNQASPATAQSAGMSNPQNRPAQSPAPAQQTPTSQQPSTSFAQQQQQQQPQGAAQPPRPTPFSIQQPMGGNSPQTQVPTGQNATSTQSLSHQGALAASQAARAQYPGSNPPSAGAVAPAGSNPPSTYGNGPVRNETQIAANPKMPIPKHLTTTAPTPVQMSPGRPTLTGVGSGPGVQGVMGQPVMQKPPGYTLEGEGEHVLSRKKLDELVRQVTGAEGPGTGLSPDCEEAMLSVADEFIDDVITAACRLAKLRDGAMLDIRDIQIILERNYNIRIPGYALDEVRTVKKFHPAPGWTQKMNSIQAAKVMGGKNDV